MKLNTNMELVYKLYLYAIIESFPHKTGNK